MTFADILAKWGIIPDADTPETAPAIGGAMQILAQSALALDSALLALEDPFVKIQALAEAAAAKLDAFVGATRLPADRMEAWVMAAQQHHVDPGEITAAIESIQTAATQIRAGAGNGKHWEQLGISPDQDPFDVLDQMHACASTLAPAIARPVLADTGIGDGMFHLFRQQEPGFHGIDGSGRAHSSTGFPARISGFAKKLMSAAGGAVSRFSGILTEVRDAASSLHIGDFMSTWTGGMPEDILAGNNGLAWIGALQGAAEPVGNAMQLATGLVDSVDKNDMNKLMSWIAPAPGQEALPGPISPAFFAQPTSMPAQHAVLDAPAALSPNTTVNVNQYIEGTANPQKAAEDAIRRMIELTAAQLPSAIY